MSVFRMTEVGRLLGYQFSAFNCAFKRADRCRFVNPRKQGLDFFSYDILLRFSPDFSTREYPYQNELQRTFSSYFQVKYHIAMIDSGILKVNKYFYFYSYSYSGSASHSKYRQYFCFALFLNFHRYFRKLERGRCLGSPKMMHTVT